MSDQSHDQALTKESGGIVAVLLNSLRLWRQWNTNDYTCLYAVCFSRLFSLYERRDRNAASLPLLADDKHNASQKMLHNELARWNAQPLRGGLIL